MERPVRRKEATRERSVSIPPGRSESIHRHRLGANYDHTKFMSADVKIPTVGESITSGQISTWHKEDGETVAVGDVLLTLETDKVSTEITAEAAGRLRIGVPAGQEGKIGDVVGSIEASEGKPEAAAPKADAPAPMAALSSPPAQTPAPAHTMTAAAVP